MSGKNISIKFSSFDFDGIQKAVNVIVDSITRAGGTFSGPINLPRKQRKMCLLRSPHVNKISMEHFGIITYRRLLLIKNANDSIISELSKIEIGFSVFIKISVK